MPDDILNSEIFFFISSVGFIILFAFGIAMSVIAIRLLIRTRRLMRDISRQYLFIKSLIKTINKRFYDSL